METTFTAPGISCQGCANTIEQALGTIPDVAGVTVDVPNKTVTVRHGEHVPRQTLTTALAGAGYPIADDAAGHDLHQSEAPATGSVKDPVCGMNVRPETAAEQSEVGGK